jgi:hypothetical protein
MNKAMPAASSSRVIFVLAVLLGSDAGAQPGSVVLSIDRYLPQPGAGESRHEIMPVALFDGTGFRRVQDSNPRSSRVQNLLTQHPVAQVLHHGETIDFITVSDVHLKAFGCSEFFVGTGDSTAGVGLPASEIRSSIGRRENGERIEYPTETYLALSRAIEENDLEGGPVISAVTDREELQSYAADIERVAPRPELLPLRIDETLAYRFSGRDGVLVIRNRRAAEMVEIGNSRFEGTLYTDAAIVHDGPGQRAVFTLQGFPAALNGLGGGDHVQFIDAFALQGGRVFFAFYAHSGLTYFSLYRLGAASETRLVFETALYGRC